MKPHLTFPNPQSQPQQPSHLSYSFCSNTGREGAKEEVSPPPKPQHTNPPPTHNIVPRENTKKRFATKFQRINLQIQLSKNRPTCSPYWGHKGIFRCVIKSKSRARSQEDKGYKGNSLHSPLNNIIYFPLSGHTAQQENQQNRNTTLRDNTLITLLL